MFAAPPYGRYARAFTLVEMLAVMFIASILLALVVPALNSFSRTNSLVSGGDMVTNMIALARQTATSKNTMTALVLLGNQGSAGADYRAFTVLQYNVDQQTWVQNTPWASLPTGIIVDCSDATDCTFLQNSPVVFPDLASGQPTPPVYYQQKNVTSFAARIFLPNGGLLNAQEPAQIRLVEGSLLQSSQIAYTHPAPNSHVPSNYYDIAVLGVTGQTKVARP